MLHAQLETSSAPTPHAQCKGKFIWWQLQPETGQPAQLSFWSTLGMSGAWSPRRSPHSRVEFELTSASGERSLLYFNDQRNFGVLTVCDDSAILEAKLASIGPSWLADEVPLSVFLEIAERQTSNSRRAKVPLARFLMDQGKTAGIGAPSPAARLLATQSSLCRCHSASGNYLLSEALFKAGIYPWATCGDLEKSDWLTLHEAISTTIQASYDAQSARAIAAGKRSLSATRNTLTKDEPKFTFVVYSRLLTRTREALTVRKDEGPHGRSIFWVPEKQTRGVPPSQNICTRERSHSS